MGGWHRVHISIGVGISNASLKYQDIWPNLLYGTLFSSLFIEELNYTKSLGMRAQSQGNYNDMIINNIVVEIVEKLSKVDA